MDGANPRTGINEGTRRALAKEGQPPDDLPASHIIMAAGAAGILFWLLVYPTDVIKVPHALGFL